MPLILVLAVIAVVVGIAFVVGRGGDGGKQFLGTAVVVWVVSVGFAIIILTVATLIFGR